MLKRPFVTKPTGNSAFKTTGAGVIDRTLDRRGLTQTEAAYIMRDAPSQISLVVTRKLKGFSEARITRMLNRLGYDVETTIRKAKGRTGKTTVVDRSGV